MLEKIKSKVFYIESHHQAPLIDDSKRHLGIILTLIGFLLYAFYTVMFAIESLRAPNLHPIVASCSEFFFFHIFMALSYFPLCATKGIKFFECKNIKLIIIRGIFSIICIVTYSLARIWTDAIDNSMLYATDAFWVVLFMLAIGLKIRKIAIVGVLLGTLGITIAFIYDLKTTHSFLGGGLGLISGISLALIIFMTRYMVEHDPPLRIGFYQAVIGTVLMGIFAIILFPIYGWPTLTPQILVLMIFSGFVFALTLFCFLEAFYYTESYIIGATSYFLSIFIFAIDWIINKTPIVQPTLIGTVLLSAGGLLVIFSSYSHSKKIKKNHTTLK